MPIVDIKQNFDVIGFDPRGVNNTRPSLRCFPNHLDAAIWSIEQDTLGYMDTSDTAFDNAWASHRAMAGGCSTRAAKEVGRSLGTYISG